MTTFNKFKTTSQSEATMKSYERFKNAVKSEWRLAGHDIGIHPLNLSMGGHIKGKLTTIAGRSGHGKTALLADMFKAGGRVLSNRRAEFLFYSWEMDSSYLVDRHICNEVGITSKMLNQGAKLLKPEQSELIKSAYGSAQKLPVEYQSFRLNIREVETVTGKFCERVKEKEKVEGLDIIPVVVIDYIGLASFDGSGLRTYGIGDFMNGAKQIANSMGAHVIAICQISRGADNKEAPDLTDIADSQAIEMASDNLIIMHRPAHAGQSTIKNPKDGSIIESSNVTLFRQLKSRDYGQMEFLASSDIAHYRFWDLDMDYSYKYWELYLKEDFWKKHFNL